MNVLIGIGHPAHVHFYRNAIDELQSQGYSVHVVTKRRNLAIELLDGYNIEYTIAGRSKIQHSNPLAMGLAFLHFEYEVIREVRRHEPNVVTGIGNIPLSHASAIFDCSSVIFTDTEHATFANKITFPFADYIVTPECFEQDVGPKQVRYPGYHELAYLHPNRFDPDPSILHDVGLDQDDRFVILRVVDWNAIHDAGDSGFENVEDVVESLEATGVRVFITAESDIPESVEHCKLSISPHRIHHLMKYADLFIGESATMATESAVLGTPSIFVSTSRRGYTNELENKYGLVYNYSGPNRQALALSKACSVLQNYDPDIWNRRRKRMLEDKTDTTQFLIEEIESKIG